jgi:methylenetetrahydrofolate dehydrogenase (NADP+)/methenyltetrahydrofolate cyclohydrolase
MAVIIDGKKISAEIRGELAVEVKALKEKTGKTPGLAVIMIGDSAASEVYVGNKIKACADTGINSFHHKFDSTYSQKELIALIDKLNADPSVNGILVQLPLPSGIDEVTVLNRIDPLKDADGFHPVNTGKLVIGDPDCFYPCTPYGIQELIVRYMPDISGKHLVVVGRSNIVGKPIANMMVQKNKRANCIVTMCHTAAPDISYYTKQADILVVAAGRANTVTADMVKDGVVVIDVGVNRLPDPANPGKTKLYGDVDFEGVSQKASAITPVPGGVGPMTITMLLKNTVKAFRIQNSVL